MSPKEFEAKLLKKLSRLKTADLVYDAATAVHVMQLDRLFVKGRDGLDTPLGEYDSTPAYFTKKQFKKQGAFKAQGKPTAKAKQQGATRRRNQLDAGNSYQRTSMYLPYGYKQLKAIQGYESRFVNFTYSADLRNDFATKLKVVDDKVIATVSRDINAKKVDWLTAKYGPESFTHTEKEIEFFKDEVTKKLIDYLSK